MSKLAVVGIIALSVIPIALFAVFYEAPVTYSDPVLGNQPITIPEVDPQNPKAAQCKICEQISGTDSKEQCMKDFDCS